MARKKTFSFFNLLIAFLAASFVFILNFFPFFDTLERHFLDLSFRIRGPEAPHPSIVIVDINDQSILKMGSWPWPRSHYRDFLMILGPYQPKAVFFDFIFSETSNEEDDKMFAQTIKEFGMVILPFYFSGQTASEFSEKNAVFPLLVFREAAKRLGYVNVFPDKDGHIREFVPRTSVYEHASFAIAAVHHDPFDLQKGLKEKMLINFPGPYEVFRSISFDDLIERYETPDMQSFLNSLKDKIVLVGHTAAGTSMDLKPVAFSPQYPGVGLQASMLHTLLSGKLIRKIPLSLHFIFLFAFALLILCFNLISNPIKGLFYTSASLAFIFLVAQLAFQLLLLWIPCFAFIVLGASLFIIGSLIGFIQIRIEREIFARELALASRIQKNLLPAEIPNVPGVEIAALSIPARHVGGDFYDVLPLPNGKWGICVGDVSGKGIPAALFMAKAISEFRREADSSPPSAVLQRLNRKVVSEGFSGLFFTLLYLVIDPEKKKLIFSNGGHEPIFIYKKKTHKVEVISTQSGIPLGIDSESDFDDREINLEVGDVLLLQSDGVKEAMNEKREIFGPERLKATMLESDTLGPKSLVQYLIKQIEKFVKDAPQHDDLTLLCIKCA